MRSGRVNEVVTLGISVGRVEGREDCRRVKIVGEKFGEVCRAREMGWPNVPVPLVGEEG